MKKKFLWSFFLISILLLTGCFNKGSSDIVETVTKKLSSLKNYHVNGELEIINNEESYKYSVDVSFAKTDQFRVSLKNQINNHEQIILKNSDGVYVLTPSLNKSFKFQSEWPYNNSQSYILQSILSDIKGTKDKATKSTKDGFTITTKVNYSNNKKLTKQTIYVDKKGNLQKVEVLDQESKVKIKMTFKTIDFKATFEKNYFDLNQNMNVSGDDATNTTMESIDDIIYPMYLPENTYLSSQDKVSLDKGERIILTFAGDSPFMIVEETVKAEDEFTTIPVYGDPDWLMDTIGSVTDNSLTWISNGIEYYAVSETLNQAELLEVVQSISVMPVGK